jgi:hypothetical protein
MFIPDPGSQILIFIHPGSQIRKQQQKRGVKKIFVGTNIKKIKNYLIFNLRRKKFGPLYKELP